MNNKQRTVFVRVDKTDDVLKTFNHYNDTSDISEGKNENFWKEVVAFEKEQGRVKTQARLLLFELPLSWKEIPQKQLKKRCGKLIRKVLHGSIGYTYFIRTATNNDNNFHMIVLFSERMSADLFVIEKRDQYRCSETGKIVSSECTTAIKVASKGDIKKDAAGKALINTAAFGVKNAKYKSREWLYEVKKITVKHFRLYNAAYTLDSLSKYAQLRYSGFTKAATKLLRSVNSKLQKISAFIRLNPKSKKAKVIELTLENFLKKRELKEMIVYIDAVIS